MRWVIFHPVTGARFTVPDKWRHRGTFERWGWQVYPDVAVSLAEILGRRP